MLQGWLIHIITPQACCCCTFLLEHYIIWWRSAIPGQRPEIWLSSDCSGTSELQGVDIFYLQLWVRLDFLCVVWRGALGMCAQQCVSICSEVRLCSLWLISVKKLGHGVCKGACSNYCQLCSLNALPYCTLLLHRPDITIILQCTLSLAASSGVLQHIAPWTLLYIL